LLVDPVRKRVPDGARAYLLLALDLSIAVDRSVVGGFIQRGGIEPVVEAYAQLVIFIVVVIVPRVPGKPGLKVGGRIEVIVESDTAVVRTSLVPWLFSVGALVGRRVVVGSWSSGTVGGRLAVAGLIDWCPGVVIVVIVNLPSC
jgi:hypothetical protein